MSKSSKGNQKHIQQIHAVRDDSKRFKSNRSIKLNKLWNENCLLTLRRLPYNSIDLILTSPPYDNMRKYNGYSFEFEAIAKEIVRVLKPGGVVVWIVGDETHRGSESGTSFRQALYFKSVGLNQHDTMIYEKSGFARPSTNRYHQTFEYMFILSKGKPKTFNPIKDRPNKYVGIHGGERSFRGEFGMRTNIWRYAVGGNNTSTDKQAFKHPAPMPDGLARDHIISWSDPGDLIYEPFCGSGTTIVQAEILGRKWIASEISEEYCELIKQRLAVAKRQMAKSKKRPLDDLQKAA